MTPSRTAWLDAGLELLAEYGAPALRIDRLAARLGLTKGSFYHHFAGLAGYRLSLLDHYESRFTGRFVAQLDVTATPSAADRRRRLTESVLAENAEHLALHVAVRAWAMQDDDVRATMQNIDRNRLDFLTTLYAEEHGEHAALAARATYLLLIGARHVLPPLDATEIRNLHDWLLTSDAVKGPAPVSV